MPVSLKLAPLLICFAACMSDECLPEPDTDTSPPMLRVIVESTPPGGVSPVTREVTADDSVAVPMEADRMKPVHVTFVAADAEGLLRLHPAVTIQRTVGIGVDRQYTPMDPEIASCPLPELQIGYEAHTSGEPRVVIVSAVAENWKGLLSMLEPLSIRMK